MISHILSQVARFRRTHGYNPNTLFISPTHCTALEESCPGIFSSHPPVQLGLTIQIATDRIHPEVGFVRPNPHWDSDPQQPEMFHRAV